MVFKKSHLILNVLLFLLIGCSVFEKNSDSKTPSPSQNSESTKNDTDELPDYDNSQVPSLDTNLEMQTFSFGSCAIQNKPQPIWTTILNQKPQLYLGLGDNVYASRPEDKPISKSYKKQMQFAEFANFRKQIPMLGVYDDHDYGVNDGGIENPEKETAKNEYLKFFPLDKNFISSTQDGIYHEVVFGKAPRRIHFIFLDTRWFRDSLEENPDKNSMIKFFPTKDTKKTILGKDQWSWLEKSLKKPAEIKIIISSIQFLPTEHGFEKWQNFPHERQKLIQLIEKSPNKNMIILSGDRHLGEISKLKTKKGQIIEVTASSINRASKIFKEQNSLRLSAVPYFDENFGLGQIDWKQKQIKLKLMNLSGNTVSETAISF